MNLAPVVIFAYNRPWHLSQMFDSLRANHLASFSEIIVFCDGPKANATQAELERIKEVRRIASAQTWCKALRVVASERNTGLANSVLNGISSVLEKHESVIVIEDDVLLSPVFLDFMNDALTVYAGDDRLLSVGAWNYFYNQSTGEDHFFLTMPDTIAWATWRRAWIEFNPDSSELIRQLMQKKLMRKLNLNGQYDFEGMLRAEAAGYISSWAIRWTAHAVLHDKLSIYPAIALAKHTGFGTDATNCFGFDFNGNLALAQVKLSVKHTIPIHCLTAEQSWMAIERNVIHADAVINYPLFSAITWKRMKRRIKKILGRA